MSEQSHVYVEGYKHISTVVEETKTQMKKVRSGEIKPLFTSLQKETEYIGGYYPSDQIIIAGRTGCGKSAKVLHDVFDFVNPSINPYYHDKLIILFDSWEMPPWRLMLRSISRNSELEVKALLDYKQRLEEERFQALLLIADKFKKYPIYLSTRSCTAIQWEENKKQAQGKFPTKTIVNIFDHTRLVLKGSEVQEESLIHGLMLAGMRLKNNFAMINIFLSQMNRNIEVNVSRDKMGTYTPVSSDIFGSDSCFQSSDIVIALHRPGAYGVEKFENIPTGIDLNDPDKQDDLLIECILKQRDGWTGNLLMKHNLAHNKIWDYPTITQQIAISSDWFDNKQLK